MSIIIDANRASDFSGVAKNHAPEILRRIAGRKLRVAVGVETLKELMKTKLSALIPEWSRASILVRVDEALFAQRRATIVASWISSDDPHVLALACASGCRLLYTDDEALIIDFKDKRIVSPKGRVFKSATKESVVVALLEGYGR